MERLELTVEVDDAVRRVDEAVEAATVAAVAHRRLDLDDVCAGAEVLEEHAGTREGVRRARLAVDDEALDGDGVEVEERRARPAG
jgi:hypothetical protein